MKDNNEFLHNQLIKLGDMMGDGLHHEPDGKWIAKEYRKIAKLLYPEMYKKKPKTTQQKEKINEQMAGLMANGCPKCSGTLVQVKNYSKTCKCTNCGAKFTARSKNI